METTVLFEDEAIVAAIKPVGVLSEDVPGGECLPALLRERTGLTAVFTVHRLDTAVGGVTVCAKTKAAAARLSASIREGTFIKYYRCVVRGMPPTEEGTLEDLLFHDRRSNKTFVVKRARKGVKPAKLAFTLLSRAEDATGPLSLLEIRLYTGRTHQIRVQLASRGTPLAGDRKYGARDGYGAPALFCTRLEFPHPLTGETVRLEAQPPQAGPWSFFD